ncbi:TPA: PAS domain-containing protein [Streptococcus agalactiae]|uniref:sensor histidine kinase n=1 Tax=Streptococcus agalactiae TaxID=1311 RepID=UPI00123DD041|nr:ATP-binding protein [Streptococcus agalactiae]KAA9037485.1 PAS domain-containing sensor histidine kinase [Streptococcus agalactiae]KAF0062461.1 PAS domain-containing sensor histidine kinase [Streptococcus agalactiae]KAF0075713.1 PAS domain-containing sensor histidine kinase [Streptococcus agalactiae]KAF0083620.1 PAS domain-containing sensor histidine kinase [Streptococcus agalactiae]MCC9790846.1 PAS domain-containing sensor histidine kinase [Streptococcus agalactiae]
MTKKIFRTTLSASLGIVLVTILMIMGFLYNYFNHIQREQLRTQTALASQGISFEGKDYFENLKTSNVRITWVDNKGQVLYDTQSDAKHMKNHANRQEIKEAIKSGYGESTRWSATLTEKSIYAAQRLNNGTIVRLSVAQQTIFYLLLGMISPLAIIILLAIILSVLIARYIAKKVSEPLNNIDLDHPLSNDSYEEITPLLRRLDSHQAKIQHQKLLLQKRQKEFDTIISKIKEGMILLDDQARIVSINAEALKLFQINDDWHGRFMMEVSRDLTLKDLIDQGLKGKKKEANIGIENNHYRVLVRPTTDNNRVTGLVVLLFDVTDQLQMEQLQREFTANVSHELKTPLHVISGYSELLANQMVPNEEVPQFAAKIHKESERLVKLVEDIINLSHLDEQEKLPQETVNLYDLTQKVLEGLQAKADKKHIQINFNGEEAILRGNPVLLNSLVYNLCDNAITYNHEKGQVNVTLKNSPDTITLEVSDMGLGIAEKDKKRIFERFYRVDKSRSKIVGGTGLGLSIVKSALDFHNGSIKVDSHLGQGTTMTVLLHKQ